MGTYRRRGNRRYSLPRKTRLIISACVLVVLIAAIVLLVRSCGARPDEQSAPAQPVQAQPAEAAQPSETPGAAQAVYDDSGDDEDLALQDVGDETVDLASDLAPAQTPSLPAGNRQAVIRSIGDIVAHVPILKAAYVKSDKSYDFSGFFTEIKAAMGRADYTVLNVDGPLGGKKYASYRGYPQFNTPPQLLLALKDCGVDMLTLANNHALDTYFDGLIGTINNVEKAGLEHVGAYRTQAEYDTPKIVDINGILVGFLNYTTGTNNLERVADKAATQYGLRYTGNSNAPKDIKALRDAGAEAVVVYMHWGEEYVREVSPALEKMANKLCAAGADVIVGGHPHVVMPCKYISATTETGETHQTLVLYSMGNFLSDQRARYRDSGIIFEFTLQDNPDTGKVEAVAPRYVPTYVQRVKNGSAYDYRVLDCGDVIAKRPSGISDEVFKRIKQVWNEQKQVMESGPAQIAQN